MSEGREVHCYDYVNHSYDEVRSALVDDAVGIFQGATGTATDRAGSVASSLKVDVAGVELSTKIDVRVEAVHEDEAQISSPAKTRIELVWEAENRPRLFPFMKAELSIYPLSARETQLDLLGHYQPPLGPLGTLINATVGHRIAEASVHRFLNEVASHLKNTLS